MTFPTPSKKKSGSTPDKKYFLFALCHFLRHIVLRNWGMQEFPEKYELALASFQGRTQGRGNFIFTHPLPPFQEKMKKNTGHAYLKLGIQKNPFFLQVSKFGQPVHSLEIYL